MKNPIIVCKYLVLVAACLVHLVCSPMAQATRWNDQTLRLE